MLIIRMEILQAPNIREFTPYHTGGLKYSEYSFEVNPYNHIYTYNRTNRNR